MASLCIKPRPRTKKKSGEAVDFGDEGLMMVLGSMHITECGGRGILMH